LVIKKRKGAGVKLVLQGVEKQRYKMQEAVKKNITSGK
jgi:hypothetical protein